MARTPRWPDLPRSRNWRFAVPVGALAIVASFGLVLPAPFVFPAVLAWWLHIDLATSEDHRLGWLGGVALVVFAIAASGVVMIVVGLDAHFDCGGTLGGFGESASARLDEACASRRAWRPVAGGVAMIAVTIVAGLRVRRSSGARSDASRAAITMVGLAVFMAAVIVALVLS